MCTPFGVPTGALQPPADMWDTRRLTNHGSSGVMTTPWSSTCSPTPNAGPSSLGIPGQRRLRAISSAIFFGRGVRKDGLSFQVVRWVRSVGESGPVWTENLRWHWQTHQDYERTPKRGYISGQAKRSGGSVLRAWRLHLRMQRVWRRAKKTISAIICRSSHDEFCCAGMDDSDLPLDLPLDDNHADTV